MRRGVTLNSVIAAIMVLVALTRPMLSQSPGTGAIGGTIVDSSGALLAKVSVTVSNEDTETTRAASSSSAGTFRVSLLPPGTYSISAVSSGFATQRVQSIHVGAGEVVTVELRLLIGKAHESVQVNGSSDLAQLESSTLGRTVDQMTIHEPPLSNRNYTQIVALSPNVVVEHSECSGAGKEQSERIGQRADDV